MTQAAHGKAHTDRAQKVLALPGDQEDSRKDECEPESWPVGKAAVDAVEGLLPVGKEAGKLLIKDIRQNAADPGRCQTCQRQLQPDGQRGDPQVLLQRGGVA